MHALKAGVSKSFQWQAVRSFASNNFKFPKHNALFTDDYFEGDKLNSFDDQENTPQDFERFD